MNIFQTIGNFFRRKKSIGANQYGWQPFGGSASPLPYTDPFRSQVEPSKVQLIAYAMEDVAACCSGWIARMVAKTPLRLYVADGVGERKSKGRPVTDNQYERLRINKMAREANFLTEVTDHAILDLLYAPNDYLSSHDFFELISLYLDAVGESFIWMGDDQLNTISSLWILPSQFVSVVPNPNMLTPDEYYWAYGTAVESPLDADKMCFIHMKNLHYPYLHGWGAVRKCLSKLSLSDAQLSYQQICLQNQARPDALLSPDEGGLGWEESQRLAKLFMQNFKGNATSGIMVAPEAMTITPLGFPLKEILDVSFLRYVKGEIAATMGVPLSLIDSEASNTNNGIATAYRQGIENAVQPRLGLIEEKLNATLIKKLDPTGKFFVAFDDITPRDDQLDVQVRSLLISEVQAGIRLPNEAREELGLPKMAWGNQPIAQASMSPSVPIQRTIHQPMIEAEFKLLKSMKPKDYQSQEHNYEPLGNIINDFFSEVGKAVAEQCKDVDLGNYEGKSFLTDQERCQRYCQWKKALPEPTFSLDDWSKLMFGKCFPMLNLWGKKSADGLMSHFGVDTSLFPVVNEHVADTIKELTIKLCADTLATSQYLVEDSIERLKAEINSGIFTGDGSRELVNRVQEIFNDKKRAYNIAQTEESRIRHSAEATSIKETGLKMGKKFLLDTLNACDQCRAVKAKYPGVVPMETLWSNNAYTREAGGIPIHPSCMCSQSYSLEGEE